MYGAWELGQASPLRSDRVGGAQQTRGLDPTPSPLLCCCRLGKMRMKDGTPGCQPKELLSLTSSLGCLQTSTASCRWGPLCPYLYSDRVGLREGAGGGAPSDACARATSSSAPVRSDFSSCPRSWVSLHCLPASQATPVLFVT